jgi:excisionase family DNA binding protein
VNLEAFIAREREVNDMLEHQGATAQAVRGTRLLDALEEELARIDDTLTVEEAAHLAGVSPETVRRAVRRGAIRDLRTNPKGTMRIPRSAVEFLRGRSRTKRSKGGYDPIAHARRLIG